VEDSRQGRLRVLNFRGSDNLLNTVGCTLLSKMSLGLHVRVDMASYCKSNKLESERHAKCKGKVKVRFLYSVAYAMTGPARFTISEVAVNWQEPMVLQR